MNYYLRPATSSTPHVEVVGWHERARLPVVLLLFSEAEKQRDILSGKTMTNAAMLTGKSSAVQMDRKTKICHQGNPGVTETKEV